MTQLWKPWFIYRPSRIVRRAFAALRPPSRGYAPLRTSWGGTIIADPARDIGRSILTTGVYDLAVSEALARLVSPGDSVIDAGANIGYMTVLASLAAPGGHVASFEPHPDLFRILQQNVGTLPRGAAHVDLHEAALGEHPGTARLRVPAGFERNDGIARVERSTPADGVSVSVRMETLDDVLGDRLVEVLKLDVEGYEAPVLRGGARALAARRIRHIVFEDLRIHDSEVVRLLGDAGYRIFSLGWAMRGPVVRPVERGSLAKPYEAPSFIATLAPEVVVERCRPSGWRVLTDPLRRPSLS